MLSSQRIGFDCASLKFALDIQSYRQRHWRHQLDHMRAGGNHKHTTVPEHMPSSHRRYAGWTIDRIRQDARLIGPATTALCELILEQRPHPEQGFRACLGIVRLAGPYGPERLEAAAERAIDIGARTYGSVKSILDNHLDRRPAHKRATDATPILHSNIRGPRYY